MASSLSLLLFLRSHYIERLADSPTSTCVFLAIYSTYGVRSLRALPVFYLTVLTISLPQTGSLETEPARKRLLNAAISPFSDAMAGDSCAAVILIIVTLFGMENWIIPSQF